MIEYIGALHIHSTFSDGTGEVPDITKAADEIGLDFIILTDHNTLRALDEGYEKWYGNTLCLVGCEINDKENKNHYLAFGIDKTFSTRISAKNYVKKVKEAGGIGFLAHPHEKRSHMKEHPPYPWVEWDTSDFTGIEIWNHMSEWMENLTEQNKYQAFLHPLRTIEAPPQETLKLWDNLNLQRSVVGIGGVDAHAHKQSLFGFFEVEIFPYKVLFKSIRTHIFLEEELKKENSKQNILNSKQAVYNAFERGRCFVANDYHADSKGFRFFAESSKRKIQMGESIPFNKDISLNVVVPIKGAEIQILRNGKVIRRTEDRQLQLDVKQPGAYRVQVYLIGKAWIFSNHIRIGL
jgi:hypothetical protein